MRRVFLFVLGAAGLTSAQSTDPVWVPGSTQKICQPNGENDYETGLATVSKTQTNYGLVGNDLGSSFLHDGKLWILFGDTNPTDTFKGQPNSQTDPPRIAADNDAVASTASTNISQCLTLDFVKDSRRLSEPGGAECARHAGHYARRQRSPGSGDRRGRKYLRDFRHGQQ